MVRRLTEQLNAAFIKTGWSVAMLLEKSDLPIDRSSLHRKLHGKVRMNTDEAEILADVLQTPLSYRPRKRPA